MTNVCLLFAAFFLGFFYVRYRLSSDIFVFFSYTGFLIYDYDTVFFVRLNLPLFT